MGKICVPASQSDSLKFKKKQPIFLQLKPRMVMTPLAISPPSSTPEPDMSSIPQDAATIPHSATPQVLTGRAQNTNPHLESINSLLKPIIHLFLPPYQSASTSTNRQTLGPTWTERKFSSFLITLDPTGHRWCSSRRSRAALTAPSSRKRSSLCSHKATEEKRYQVLYKGGVQVLLSSF